MDIARLVFIVALAFACCFGQAVGAQAKGPKERPDPIQTVLDRVAGMKLPEQQAWLRRMEKRLAHAARLTQKPAAAARQEARVHALLYQKQITWKTLRIVVQETDVQEKDAIDRLVRRYRGLVFDVFRKQDAMRAERQDAWGTVYRDWQAAGSQFWQQDRLIDWLEAAIRSATPGQIAPIPEKPIFESAPPPSKAAPKQPESDTPKPPSDTPKPSGDIPNDAPKFSGGIPKPPADNVEPSAPEEPEKPAETTRLTPMPRAAEMVSAIPTPRAAEPPLPRPEPTVPEKPVKTARTITPPRPFEPLPPRLKSMMDETLVKTSSIIAPPHPAQPMLPKPEPVAIPKPIHASLAVTPSYPVEPPLPRTEPTVIPLGPRHSSPVVPLPLGELVLDGVGQRRAKDFVGALPSPPARREPLRRALVADARLPSPSRSPSSISTFLPKVEEEPVPRVAAVPSDERSTESIGVKIDELSARIAGCNLAFRALESGLDEKGIWTAARLTPFLDRLEILTLRRNDLDLFRHVVPEEKRSSLRSLESSKIAISQVGARIFEARRRLFGPSFKGSDSERQAELRRLDELSQRLAELAGK